MRLLDTSLTARPLAKMEQLAKAPVASLAHALVIRVYLTSIAIFAVVCTCGDAVLHAGFGAAHLAFCAVHLLISPFWRGSAYRRLGGEALQHTALSLRSFGAMWVMAAPALCRPSVVKGWHNYLVPSLAPKTPIERLMAACRRAWRSPYRNAVLVGASVVCAALAFRQLAAAPAVSPKVEPPLPPESIATDSAHTKPEDSLVAESSSGGTSASSSTPSAVEVSTSLSTEASFLDLTPRKWMMLAGASLVLIGALIREPSPAPAEASSAPPASGDSPPGALQTASGEGERPPAEFLEAKSGAPSVLPGDVKTLTADYGNHIGTPTLRVGASDDPSSIAAFRAEVRARPARTSWWSYIWKGNRPK